MKKENIISVLWSWTQLIVFPICVFHTNLNKDYYGKAEIVWNSYMTALTLLVATYLMLCVVPFCIISLFGGTDEKTLNVLQAIKAFITGIFVALVGEPVLAIVAYGIVRLIDTIPDKLKEKV